MMIYLIAALAAVSAAMMVLAVASWVPSRPRALARQLAALGDRRARLVPSSVAPRGTPTREHLARVLRRLGASVVRSGDKNPSVRQILMRAGYRRADALAIYWGTRFALLAASGALALLAAGVMQLPSWATLVAALWFAVLGWLVPVFHVLRRMRARQRELGRALPDALDLLVVCVEAGLGLNQALMRTAEEIRHFSSVTGEEIALVNLEIRAGAPRDVALRNLGERTGVDEIRSLASMLVQTDRFGTSIAQALRVHSDSLRSRRRHRTEEQAAKTSIKLIFPLVLCIFPTIFVVVLGPVIIQMMRSFSGM